MRVMPCMPCHACTCMHEKCLGVTSHAHTPKNMSPKSGSSTHADAQATFRHLRFINASVCDRQALGQGGVDSEVQVQLCSDKKQPLLHKAARTTFEDHVAVANCSFGTVWNGQPQKFRTLLCEVCNRRRCALHVLHLERVVELCIHFGRNMLSMCVDTLSCNVRHNVYKRCPANPFLQHFHKHRPDVRFCRNTFPPRFILKDSCQRHRVQPCGALAVIPGTERLVPSTQGRHLRDTHTHTEILACHV